MSLNEISIAGEVVLSKLFLIPGHGKSKIDLTGMLIEFCIYEDIYSPTLSGHIIISEDFNLIQGVPIIGEEKIEVEYYTPSLNKISKIFNVYKIEREMDDRNTRHLFQLNFISYEAIIDMNTKISKAFTGNPDKIAEDLTNKYLTKTPMDSEVSSNIIKFVSPYWSPFKCLNFLATRATKTDSYRTPDFLFYESNQNFHFRSLSSLYQQTPKTEYFYDKDQMRNVDAASDSTRNIEKEYKTIKVLEPLKTMDYLDRLMSGVYSYKVIGIDILHKTIKKNVYNYVDDFNKTKHLGASIPHTENVAFNDENCRIEYRITSPFVHNTISTDIGDEILSKRLPLLSQASLLSYEVTVPGRTDLKVGDIVILNLPDISTKKTSSDIKPDKYRAGNYIITAIKHRITQTRHQMVMNLTKDSFSSEVTYETEL